MKVFILATDTQDGFSVQAFATEAARDAATVAMLLDLWQDQELDDDDKPDPAREDFDYWESWGLVRRDDIDSLYMEECEVQA